MKNLSRMISLLLAVISFLSCKPDQIEIEIYASDIMDAMTEGVREVPVVMSFRLMGSDNDQEIEQATAIAKKYLPEGSEYNVAAGEIWDKFIIKSSIPIGKTADIEGYSLTEKTPLALHVEDGLVVLRETPNMSLLNEELKGINFLLKFELPAESTKFRIVGDSSRVLTVSAIAAFVDGKAELAWSRAMEKRKSVVIDFRGGEASVYSSIQPQFRVEFERE